MTVTSNRPSRRGESAAPPDGALLRLAVDSPEALGELPPAPKGDDVSVSFSSPRAEANAAAPFAARGYRTVGVSLGAAAPGRAVADLLVPQTVIDRHPRWWRELAGRAEEIFSLAAGPVQAAFAEVLRTHREPLR